MQNSKKFVFKYVCSKGNKFKKHLILYFLVLTYFDTMSLNKNIKYVAHFSIVIKINRNEINANLKKIKNKGLILIFGDKQTDYGLFHDLMI